MIRDAAIKRPSLARAARLVLIVASAACASSGAGSATQPTRNEAAALAPRGRRLEVLPESSTYAWVLPSQLFERVLPMDDASAGDGDSFTARNAVETVLRGNAWTSAPRGTAEFEIALFVQRRQRTTVTETQRTEPPVPCEPATRPPTNPCPRPRPLPPVRQVQTWVEEKLVLGIRRADGAGYYRVEPFTDGARTGNVVAQDVLKRILASRSR